MLRGKCLTNAEPNHFLAAAEASDLDRQGLTAFYGKPGLRSRSSLLTTPKTSRRKNYRVVLISSLNSICDAEKVEKNEGVIGDIVYVCKGNLRKKFKVVGPRPREKPKKQKGQLPVFCTPP